MASASACQLYSWRHLLSPRFKSTGFPLLLQASHLLDTLVYTGHETFPSPPPLPLPLLLLLSPFSLSFLFPLEASLSTTAAPLSAPLQTPPLCRWTYFTAPYTNTHTQACARSQTEAALLNGAAAREIRARLHYEKKLADFIKDCSVNKRTGCPD